ncbi:MAG TPA: hypothetical protein VJ773_01080 [Gemmatimonadales bacterium]|nr:hypothetical protein [Gemmatimonadales bacterium]HJS46556.1 hypothetical protein [Gemmatimonadales bacterium]
MPEKPRDWDRELADIDKLMGSEPPALPTARRRDGEVAGQLPAGPQPAVPPSRRPASAWAAWLKAGLGALLAAAMTQWPYAHRCGLGTLLYLGAAGVVVVAGIWSAASSWRRRAATAHVIGLAVVLAGLALVALEVAPRVGYAKTTLPWMCE